MQLMSKIAPHLVAGLKQDPTELQLPGQGYKVPSTRDIPGRTWMPLDDGEDEPNLRAAYAALPPRPGLEPDVINALGGLYGGRHARRLATRAAGVAKRAAFNPSILTRLAETDPELAAAAADILAAPGRLWTPSETQAPTQPGANREPASRTTATGNTLAAATWVRCGQHTDPEPAEDTPALDTPPSLPTGAIRHVYALIAPGAVHRTADIVARSDYSTSHTKAALNALATDGLIEQPRHGQWTRAA